jgi:hypothetical protein
MSTRQRIVITVLLALSVIGIVYAFQHHSETVEPPRPVTVMALFPKQGDTILKQDTIWAELAFPYIGTLAIDDVQVPQTQLRSIQTGNRTRISYTPGPAAVTGYLRTGSHRADVKYWHPERPSEVSTYSWSFNVK